MATTVHSAGLVPLWLLRSHALEASLASGPFGGMWHRRDQEGSLSFSFRDPKALYIPHHLSAVPFTTLGPVHLGGKHGAQAPTGGEAETHTEEVISPVLQVQVGEPRSGCRDSQLPAKLPAILSFCLVNCGTY